MLGLDITIGPKVFIIWKRKQIKLDCCPCHDIPFDDGVSSLDLTKGDLCHFSSMSSRSFCENWPMKMHLGFFSFCSDV